MTGTSIDDGVRSSTSSSTPSAVPGLAGRIPELDGLRGVAILMVILWHYGVAPASPAHEVLCRFLGLAWSGVDLFFVLSGFLIGGILLDARDSASYFRVFYARRSLRILPLYYLLVLMVGVGAAIAWTGDMAKIAWMFHGAVPVGIYLLFAQNIWSVWTGGMSAGLLAVTWSLAVEEQFYLTLPLAVRFLSRRRLLLLTCAACAIPPVLRYLFFSMSPRLAAGGYVLLPCRADALAYGVLAALLLRTTGVWEALLVRRRALWGCLLALLATSFALCTLGLGVADGMTVRSPLAASLTFSSLGLLYLTGLLLVLLGRDGRLGRVMRLRVLTEAGLLCYGLYLLHLPVRDVIWGLTVRPVDAGNPWFELECALPALVVVFILSEALWHGFEKHFVRMGHRLHYGSAVHLRPKARFHGPGETV